MTHVTIEDIDALVGPATPHFAFQLRARVRDGDVTVEQVLRRCESPADALVAEADETGAGLLVVGSRGLGGVRELLLGSVSHACCRHAHCPVLVVPPVRRS